MPKHANQTAMIDVSIFIKMDLDLIRLTCGPRFADQQEIFTKSYSALGKHVAGFKRIHCGPSFLREQIR